MKNMRGVRAMMLVAALTMAAVGCERGDLQEPVGQSAPIELSFSFSSALGGPADAFDRADNLWVRVRAGSVIRFEKTFPIDANGADLRIPIAVRLMAARENASIDVELRLGDAPIFRGTSPVVLRMGRATSANLVLEPVPAGLSLPAIPTLESYGDSVRTHGAVVFATGDTIEVASVTWTSLDPGVIEVRNGVPVARIDGEARLVARIGEFVDTVTVRVFAVARRIVVDPPTVSLGLGESRTYTAKLFDARGNPILTPRPITWQSSDTTVIRIDEDGTATGVGVGSARIFARSGAAESDVTLQAQPGSPHATTELPNQIITSTALLHGTVHSGGAATKAWFQWGKEPTLTVSFSTPKQNVPAGNASVPLEATLTGLQPNTAYFYRLVAQSGAGTSYGETLTFSTKAGAPVVQTGSATNITQSSATLNGSAISNGAGTAWFEYGTSSTLTTFTQTATQALGAGTAKIGISTGIGGLQPTTMYWFRIVVQTAAGTMRGQILSFTTQAPPPGAPAAQTDSSNAITQTGASLFGQVTPNGAATQAWFEYGTDPLLAGAASTTPQAAGNGNAPVPVTDAIAGLTPGTTYYFRMVASSTVGTVPGAILSFTTDAPPPVAPTVTTDPASSITFDGATLFATVNPNGYATQLSFEYATDPTLAGATTTAVQNVGAGTTAAAHGESITGLVPNTQYWFRAVASNAGGTVHGAIVSFTTAAAPLAPLAFTDSAADIGPDSAFVYGRVNPQGSATLAWFEWSDHPSFTNFGATVARNIGAGNAEVSISDSIPNLDENTTYYVRTAASNAGGVVRGNVINFTTFMSGPVEHAAVTLPATNVDGGVGTVQGTATANQSGFPTEWWFEFGLDPALAGASTTGRVLMGPDLTPQDVSVPLTGLVVGGKYYYRLVVSSVGGREYGAILNFTAF